MNEQDILTHDTENRHYKITWTGDINNWAKVFDENCSFVGTIKSIKTTEAILYNSKEKGEKGYSPCEQKKCLKITPSSYLDFSSVVDSWFDFTNYDYYLKFYYVGYSNRLSNYTFLYTNIEQMLTIDGTTKQCVFPGSYEYGFNGWEIVKIFKGEEAQPYKFKDKDIKSLVEDGLVSLTTDNTNTLINIKNKNDLFSKMTAPAFKINNKYCYEGVTEKTGDNITDDEYFWIGKDNDSNEGYYNNKLTEEKGRKLMGFLDKQYEVVYQPFETDGSPSELQTRARIKLDYNSNTKTLTISQYALKVYSDASCTNKVTNESLQSFNEDAATTSSVDIMNEPYSTIMTKYKYSSSVEQYYSKFELYKQKTKQLEKPYIYLFGVEKTEPIEVDGRTSKIILQKSNTKYGCIDLSKNNSVTFDFITIGKESGVFSGSTDKNYDIDQTTTRLYQKQINVPVYKAQSLSSNFFPYTTTTLEWSRICNAIKNRDVNSDQGTVNSITYYINTDFYSTNLKYYSINTDYGYSEDDTTYTDTYKSLQIQRYNSTNKGNFFYRIDYSYFSAFSLEHGIYYNMPGVGDIKYKYNTIQSRFLDYATDGIDFSWFLWWDVCPLVINKSIKPLYEEWIKSDYNLQSYIHYPLPAWPNLFLTSTDAHYDFDKALVHNGAYYIQYYKEWAIAQCYGLLYGDNNEIFNYPITYSGDFPVNSTVDVRNPLGNRKLIRRNNASIPNAKPSEYNGYNFTTYPDRIYNADGVTPAAIIIFAQVA